MFLILVKGSNPGNVFILKKYGATIVGRDKECDTQILDPKVSRKHFKIEERENNYYMTDLGSTNKTFVNKNIIQGEQKLEVGNTIEVGDTILLFTDQKEISIKSVDDYNKMKINQTMRFDLPPK